MKIKNCVLNATILTLMLYLLVLTACSTPRPVILPESETVALKQGQPAPHDGFLVSQAAMYRLLKKCEEVEQ